MEEPDEATPRTTIADAYTDEDGHIRRMNISRENAGMGHTKSKIRVNAFLPQENMLYSGQ